VEARYRRANRGAKAFRPLRPSPCSRARPNGSRERLLARTVQSCRHELRVGTLAELAPHFRRELACDASIETRKLAKLRKEIMEFPRARSVNEPCLEGALPGEGELGYP
jgi:hypothetical protein